jgi:hypothetical protein
MSHGDLFFKAKKYGARYLAQLVAKAGDRRSRLFFERRYLKRRFLPGPAMVLFLRVYSPGAMAEYPVTNRKGPVKPLKIRPSAIRPIDIVLRRSAGPGFCRPPDEDANSLQIISSPLKKRSPWDIYAPVRPDNANTFEHYYNVR